MRILVTGGRDWKDYETIYHTLSKYVGFYGRKNIVIVHGDCPKGADHMASYYAKTHLIPQELHPADWEKHGKAAGPIRNQKMVDMGADVCLVFNTGGRGTRDCWTRAVNAGIPVKVFTEKESN